MRNGLLSIVLVVVVGAGCRDRLTTSEPNPAPPGASRSGPGTELVPNRYIVVFKSHVADVSGAVQRAITAGGGRRLHTYTHALKGFAAELSPAAVAALRQDPDVAFIEQDQRIQAIEPIRPTPLVKQSPAPSWGLDRIDQRSLPLNTSYVYKNDGRGVHFYGIDTGIRSTHVEFAGRFSSVGFTTINDLLGTSDCVGHGTHTAGTVAGATVGVARGVTVHAVRVLDCTGSGLISEIAAGVDWVTANAQLPAVANMSLGAQATPFSMVLDQAVRGSIAAGITYVLAAGNSAVNACSFSPARVRQAITVAASDSFDGRASFTNLGSCVDLFAPGVEIRSALNATNIDYGLASGTSMAAPHVAGAAVLYLQVHPTATPAEVAQGLLGMATAGAIGDPGSAPNLLLYTGSIAANVWSSAVALLPTARGAMSTGVIGQLLYTIGGNTGTAATGAVHAYDPVTNGWTAKAPLPAPRERGDGVGVITGLIYVAGGWGNPNAAAPKATLYVYTPQTNTWSTKKPMPTVSGCGATGVIGGKLYVLTGCIGRNVADSRGLLHEYDPVARTWTSKAPAPHEHAYPVAGVINGKFYVAGGIDATGAVTGIVDVYDPGTNMWTTVAPMAPRYAAASGVVAGRLYAVGGLDASGNLLPGTVERYSPSSNTWAPRARLPGTRSFLTGGVVNGLLYAIGGFTTAGATRKTEVYWP